MWRIIKTQNYSASFNMAFDEAMLELVGRGEIPPTLRVYKWKDKTISLGYFQKTDLIDKEFCEEKKIHIIRRFSGGRAVYHDNDISYSFVFPKSLNIFPNNIINTYKLIAGALTSVMDELGVNIEMIENKKKGDLIEGYKETACFLSSSWYEMQVDGKKILGSAQKRTETGVLQHGTFMSNMNNMQNLYRAFSDYHEDSLKKIKDKAISMDEILSKLPSFDETYLAFKKGFSNEFGVEFFEDEPKEIEIQLANELKKQKYNSDIWNFWR